MSKITEEDMKVRLNFAFVCNGSQADYVNIREIIEKTPNVKLIFKFNCADFLYILKDHELSDEQRNYFKEKREKIKQGKR